jgi:hypothetical protein
MRHPTFDTYVRQAAGRVDRRSMLCAISGALLATASAPLMSEARDKKKDKPKKKFKRAAAECRANNPDFCEVVAPADEEDRCIAELDKCCGFLREGKGRQANQCCQNRGWCISTEMTIA